MNDIYMNFDNKCYAIDLDKLMMFCSSLPNDEKDINTEITYVYANHAVMEDENNISNTDMLHANNPLSREIREVKSNCNETFSNLRYDLVKNLLYPLLSPLYNRDGSIFIQTNEDEFIFGQKLCFNTLLKYEIIKEV